MERGKKEPFSQLCFAVGYPSGCKEETRFDGDVHAIDLKKLLGWGSCWQQTEKKKNNQTTTKKAGEEKNGGKSWWGRKMEKNLRIFKLIVSW